MSWHISLDLGIVESLCLVILCPVFSHLQNQIMQHVLYFALYSSICTKVSNGHIFRVSSDSDTKYFLSHDSNVMSYHQWKTFQVVVTDDVYPPTRLCWCNYTRGCQAVVTWCNVQHAGSVNLIDIPIVGRWQSIEFSVIWTCEL